MNNESFTKDLYYFAAANTHGGFVSYFDDVFNSKVCDRLYILKGGPGVGKSTFMKKAAKRAKEKGYSTELFLCSSDPDSLDGILVKEKRIAIIDGTSPHAKEPALAGAKDIIVNLGEAWNTNLLSSNIDEIQALSKEKSSFYSRCYKLLSCKKRLEDCIYDILSPFMLKEKMEKCASNMALNISKACEKSFPSNNDIRLVNGISCKGIVHISTFEDNSNNCIFLKEPVFGGRISSLFLNEIKTKLQSIGINTVISKNPLNPSLIDGLYIPEAKICIMPYNELEVAKCDRSGKICKIMSMTRFFDKTMLSPLKKQAKIYSKYSAIMEKEAVKCLENCGKLHQKLEKIYGSCTDYSLVEKFTATSIAKIFNS